MREHLRGARAFTTIEQPTLVIHRRRAKAMGAWALRAPGRGRRGGRAAGMVFAESEFVD